LKVERKVPELLAPAGTLETFGAALDAGADAVYIGAPGFNARNLARDLRWEEIGAMVASCHNLGKKLYIAANSLVMESELSAVIDSLAILEQFQPDALIVQDLGLMRLINQFFPSFAIHASTLSGAHNTEGVLFLAELGCDRVVLAREMTLKEIVNIKNRCGATELEIFVHGAMCFSFSGLCMFSSYLGGKSGLRGKCVQPCRRAYREGGGESAKKNKGEKGGRYLFSMNDLSGLQAVPDLVNAGISSMKIEGRLRSANYVYNIVSAYRLMLDANPEESEEALGQAEELVTMAMGRKTAPGYFFSPQPTEAITPYHSGNMGLHLGSFSAVRQVGEQRICRFICKASLKLGDRLRLHMEPSGDRLSLKLKSFMVAGQEREQAQLGEKVSFALPEDFPQNRIDRVVVYKVDGSVNRNENVNLTPLIQEARQLLESTTHIVADKSRRIKQLACGPEAEFAGEESIKKGVRRQDKKPKKIRLPMEWWLRLDSPKILLSGKLPLSPDRYLLRFDRQMLAQAGQIRRELGSRARGVIWELPPVIFEGETSRFRSKITQLLRSGFRSFQLAHLSQKRYFEDEKVHLYGGPSLNIMNTAAVLTTADVGCDGGQIAMELDRQGMRVLLEGIQKIPGRGWTAGLTVYGAPSLYTSRLAASHFKYETVIRSPKDEPYLVKKREGYTETVPTQPFSLLPYLDELKAMGLSYVVVDISQEQLGQRNIETLLERLRNSGRYSKLSTFNYLGTLE